MFQSKMIVLVVVGLLFSASEEAQAQLLRRNVSHAPSHHAPAQCAPVVHHDNIDVQQQLLLEQQLLLNQQLLGGYNNQSPIVIQNNFPPVPATLSSVYGYGGPAPFQANPFTVDPSQILRDAARLADRQMELQEKSLQVFQTMGTDLAGQAAMIAQLQARAALIDSTRPIVTQSITTSTQQVQTPQPQAMMGSNQTICLIPDGNGGYRLQIGDAPVSSAGEAPVAQSQGLGVLQSRCASCHTGAQAKGSLSLFDDAGMLSALSDAEQTKIMTSVRLGAMPPASAGEPLTDTEVAALQLLFGEH